MAVNYIEIVFTIEILDIDGRVYPVSIADLKKELLSTILDFDQQIEEMHLAFQKFQIGDEDRIPNWEDCDFRV